MSNEIAKFKKGELVEWPDGQRRFINCVGILVNGKRLYDFKYDNGSLQNYEESLLKSCASLVEAKP